MLKKTLIELFNRDLQRLAAEINLYKDDDKIWLVPDGISNSAGNLCLHLLGNLNHFIGSTLGHTGYIRHRDDEFSQKNIPRSEMIINIEKCMLIVKNTLEQLPEEDMIKDFPLEKHDKIVSNTHMLVHLFGHLSYHLGQINYHRRLLDREKEAAN